ncbi:hypothetical protein P5673_013009 [Acropora cervicornis]|uniref:Uncharacterized protein n=1 Tax=Acropora cervicornis TaxID=6130 RepID=A0AAD9V6U4_ACRCE|nr:hypothetical protein P5673_013009 [Acropora cervicornis]
MERFLPAENQRAYQTKAKATQESSNDNVLVAVVVQLASARTVLVRQSLIVLRSFLENQKPRTVL